MTYDAPALFHITLFHLKVLYRPFSRSVRLFSMLALLFFLSTPAAAADGPQGLDALVQAARKEGQIISLGMPGTWANWQDTWDDMTRLYGLKHQDTDMSSAQIIAKFAAEGAYASADFSDLGQMFAPVAVSKGVTAPYKPLVWDEIPAWGKDTEGHWVVAYTGTIAFMANTKLVPNPPTSWTELLASPYKVSIGNVGIASQANHALLACAYARGGDENNLKPALDFFATLAKQGRLNLNDPQIANIEKGEVEIALLWDFNALSYRQRIKSASFAVCIPADGSVTAGYSPIINRYAQNPNAARLAREFILSDKGQINLAKGFAKPIRNVPLSPEIAQKLLPPAQYTPAKNIQNVTHWARTSKKIPRLWQDQVLIYIK